MTNGLTRRSHFILSSLKSTPAGLLMLCAPVLFGVATFIVGLKIATAFSLLSLVILIARQAIGTNRLAIFGLVYTIPFQLEHHFIYRADYVGAADGLTVQCTDVCLLWLSMEYLLLRSNRRAKPARGLEAFFLPLILFLASDVLSFITSDDVALSAYGVVNHLRSVILLIVLAIMLAQGKQEINTALSGLICSVTTIGAICIVEGVLQANIRTNVLVDEMYDGVFRAGGLQTPTGTAGYLAALLPLAFCAYISCCGRMRRLGYALIAATGLAGLLCTVTRGACVCLILGSIPLFIYGYRSQLIRARHLACCAIAISLISFALKDRLATRLNEDAAGLNGRVGLISTALNMAADSPVVGQGINNYMLKMNYFIPKTETQDFQYLVHNKFLFTLAETGIVGLLAFLWILAVAFRQAMSLARHQLPLGAALLSSLIVMVLDMNIETYEAGPHLLNFWVIVAAIAGVWSWQESAHEDELSFSSNGSRKELSRENFSVEARPHPLGTLAGSCHRNRR